jgi:hypothetical protein
LQDTEVGEPSAIPTVGAYSPGCGCFLSAKHFDPLFVDIEESVKIVNGVAVGQIYILSPVSHIDDKAHWS